MVNFAVVFMQQYISQRQHASHQSAAELRHHGNENCRSFVYSNICHSQHGRTT